MLEKLTGGNKKTLSSKLKLSPLAMIPHKSIKYRAILDLSFELMVAGYLLLLVNDATKKCAPEEAMYQIGSVLPRMIEALAMAPKGDGNTLFSNLDIKDGFWRIVCEEGQEWNFAYVPPNYSGQPPVIVVSSSLQMGWVLPPPFFLCSIRNCTRHGGIIYT